MPTSFVQLITRSLSGLLLTLPGLTANANEKKLFLVDTGSVDSLSDYTSSVELQEIRAGVSLGVRDALRLYPRCKVEVVDKIEVENQGNFQRRVSSLLEGAQLDPDNSILIGFSRSSNALTVASLMKNTSHLGLSVGASADLRSINKNFYSMAAPRMEQWDKIKLIFKALQCKEIIGLFPDPNGLSLQFKSYFINEKMGTVAQDLSALAIKTGTCLFFGSNFSNSVPALTSLAKKNPSLTVIATGDWALSGSEVRSVLRGLRSSKITVWAPSGWQQNGYLKNAKAKRIELALHERLKGPASPILAYSYDAGAIGAAVLCSGQMPERLIYHSPIKKKLIRNYLSISKGGNLRSEFFAHTYTNKK